MVTPEVVGHVDPVCLVMYDTGEPDDVTVSARELLAARFETRG
jgi:hypothetical protein